MGLKWLPWDSYIGRGDIGGLTSHNALKWVPRMYNSFDHFPYNEVKHIFSLAETRVTVLTFLVYYLNNHCSSINSR